ncbi:hypothetical protein M1466_02785, partial [Candidatus Dependentiae bacterium]|nr:hypothetical protein [Candidatus Dependentiae bacterium]
GARAIRNHLLHDMQQSQQPQQGKSTKPFGIELALRQLRFVRLQVKLSLAFYNGKQRSYLATIVDSIVARDTAHIAFVSEQVIANIEDLILLLEKIESANDVARAQEDIKRSSDSLKELLAYLGYLVNKDAASDLQRSGLRLINNRIGQRPGMRTTAPGVMGSYGAGLGA